MCSPFVVSVRSLSRLSGAALAALLFSSLAGAATASFTSTLPSVDVFRQNTLLSASGNLQVRNLSASSERWVGVGFAAPATNTTLDRLTFFIAFDSVSGNGLVNAPALGATMRIDVVALGSLTGTPAVPYTPIYSETALLPAIYSNEAYLTFDLASSVSLTATQNYAIMLSFTDFAANRGINLRTSPSGSSGLNNVGSLFYTSDDGATYTTGANPLAFVLQSAPAAVPEPSSYALALGLAGLGAVACRRRTRRQAA